MLCPSHQCNIMNNQHREIYKQRFRLRFQKKSKYWGRGLLLEGDQWFVYHCDIMFFEDTGQRLLLRPRGGGGTLGLGGGT